MGFEAKLRACASQVEARLELLLPTPDRPPRRLHEAMRYSCLTPGKRLRPALCMLCAEAVGGSASEALNAACAIEMVHCFSLIHDDLPAIDDDAVRRGRPSCHVAFGEALAILAGDALFALAFEVVAEPGKPAATAMQITRVLAQATGSNGLVGGEVEDVLAEGGTPDAEMVRFIHTRKTGALFAASAEIGAILGGAEVSLASALWEYGTHVGLAFQITDDLLNELSSVEALGKAAGSDRGRRKATYPAVFGPEASRGHAQDAVDKALAVLGRSKLDGPELVSFAKAAIERRS